MTNQWTRRAFRTLAACLATVVVSVSPATAQTAVFGKWEIELHGGAVLPSDPERGTWSLPGPGEVFTTAAMFMPPVLVTSSSRRQSSWYFGDGPVLFDQAASALAASATAMTRPFSARITSLDPVLMRSFAVVQNGGTIGARVSRTLTPRLSAEVSVDYSLARLQITQANRDAIEATRASFIGAFNGLITSHPQRVLTSVTSTAELDTRTRQLFTSGALVVNLRTSGTVIPYTIVGASLISTLGRLPTASLTGRYQFLNPSGSPIDETDNVTVRDARDSSVAAAVFGGGMRYHVSPRWGIRLDARVSLSGNTAITLVDAAPEVAHGLRPAGRGLLNVNPTIQFSNSSEPVTNLGVTAINSSTLSGPAVIGLRTFSGSGVSSHTNITAGIFWRF
jgi:hypothetical protein